MTRDILDYQGNVIGQLEMPDGTSEEAWASALAPYAEPPIDPVQAYLNRTVAEGKLAAENVMEQFKKNNLVRFTLAGLTQEQMVLKSLWVHHRLRAVELTVAGVPLIIDLMNLCISGDIETAAYVVQNMTADDMTQPQHFLSEEVLDELLTLITSQIG